MQQPDPRYRTVEDLPQLHREHHQVAQSISGQFTRSDFLSRYRGMFPDRNPDSILPSDYCFGRNNVGNAKHPRFMLWTEDEGYRFVGLNGSAGAIAADGAASAPVRSHDSLGSPPLTGQAWIYPANPRDFDIDGYLALGLPRIAWTVRQKSPPPRPGDVVYLWRAAGDSKIPAGVVARAVASSEVWNGADDPASLPFWRSPQTRPPADRIWLDVERAAGKREVLKRDWLKEDPACRDLLILRQPQGTNFLLSEQHRDRLSRLWSRTGLDWTREECIAALWAYDATYKREISKLPESPVADVALRIGRAVSGVYNKVMNFRAIDPRDDREGFKGGADQDARTWSEFYDADRQALRSEALESAYAELWGDTTVSDAAVGVPTPVPGEPPAGTDLPGRAARTIERIIRDTAVTRWVKVAHDHVCQACGVRLAGRDGAFSEGAHIRPLGAGHCGPDAVGNVLCLCPNHHALLDRGAFWIMNDLGLVGPGALGLSSTLRTTAQHVLSVESIAYHRTTVAGQPA